MHVSYSRGEIYLAANTQSDAAVLARMIADGITSGCGYDPTSGLATHVEITLSPPTRAQLEDETMVHGYECSGLPVFVLTERELTRYTYVLYEGRHPRAERGPTVALGMVTDEEAQRLVAVELGEFNRLAEQIATAHGWLIETVDHTGTPTAVVPS